MADLAQQLYVLETYYSISLAKIPQTVSDGGPDDAQADPSYAGDDGSKANPE